MTRKDFQLIADVIVGLGLGDRDREHVAHQLAAALRTTNHAFDRERFLRACGVQA